MNISDGDPRDELAAAHRGAGCMRSRGLGSRIFRQLRHSRPARPGGRTAGAGHPRLPRQRPRPRWSSAARSPRRASASTAGTAAGTSAPAHDTIEQLKAAGRPGLGQTSPILVVGWSLGGVFAREFARAHPERVRAVVTLGSPVQRRPARRTTCGGSTNGSPGTRSTTRRSPRITDKPPVPTPRHLVAPRRPHRRRAPPAASPTKATMRSSSTAHHMAFGVSPDDSQVVERTQVPGRPSAVIASVAKRSKRWIAATFGGSQ